MVFSLRSIRQFILPLGTGISWRPGLGEDLQVRFHALASGRYARMTPSHGTDAMRPVRVGRFICLMMAGLAAVAGPMPAAASAADLDPDPARATIRDPVGDVVVAGRAPGPVDPAVLPRPTVDAIRFRVVYTQRALRVRIRVVNLRRVGGQSRWVVLRGPDRVRWSIGSVTRPRIPEGVLNDTDPDFRWCSKRGASVTWDYANDFVLFRIPVQCLGVRPPEWVGLETAYTGLSRTWVTYNDYMASGARPRVYRLGPVTLPRPTGADLAPSPTRTRQVEFEPGAPICPGPSHNLVG